MDPADAERKYARALAEQRALEQKAKEAAARVLNEMEQRHGAANLEPPPVPAGMERLTQSEVEIPTPPPPNPMSTMYASQEQAEAAELKQRALEAEQQAEFNRPRATKNPIIMRLQQRQRPLGRVKAAFENEAQRLRHPNTEAVKRFGRELAITPIKTLGNIGESALIERTRPTVTEIVGYNTTAKRFEKTITKTWTECNPFSNTKGY